MKTVQEPTPASPTFFQHITDLVFRELIKLEFVVAEPSTDSDASLPTQLEENALRYNSWMYFFINLVF